MSSEILCLRYISQNSHWTSNSKYNHKNPDTKDEWLPVQVSTQKLVSQIKSDITGSISSWNPSTANGFEKWPRPFLSGFLPKPRPKMAKLPFSSPTKSKIQAGHY